MIRTARARVLTAAVVLLLAATAARPARGASLFDPSLRFRTLPTKHFIIYFHQGEDRLATHLAAIAEETWRTLQRPLGVMPPPRTHVILVDQTELSNGFATPLPYNTVLVTAVWPAGADFIGNTDDWLRLVFTHEFTHVIHLDRSEGWARLVRGIFGRTPVAFPNLFLPTWQIEGLATYEESVITGGGRLHAGDFAAITREAARAGRPARLDRVNGGLLDWPNGYAPYAYGVGFHAYLAEKYGADKFATLAEATARRVPFTASRVFRRIYGRSLGALWNDYQEALMASARTAMRPDEATRITRHGFFVSGPRFASATRIVYSVRTPHEFPALNEVALDGSAPRRLTTRYLGSTSGLAADTIYFDQQEIHRNTGVYSDLYALDRRSEHVRRLTAEARLLDPDVSPDGRTIVCVQDVPGQRNLVVVRLKPDTTEATISVVSGFSQTSATAPVVSGSSQTSATAPVVSGFSRTISTLIAEPGTQFNAPRWSPDGRFIAVERHRLGTQSEIIIVDAATSAVRVIASRAGARIVTPAWRPDGRAIVAAVSAGDEPFNLFEFGIGGTAERALTHTTGGAIWPDVSRDGATIVFVGYTVDGQDLFTVPYPVANAGGGAEQPATATDLVAQDFSPASRTTARNAEPKFGATSTYAPWPTLAPTSWSPVIESGSSQIRIGAGISAYDVLKYHAYAVSATWLVSAPADAIRPGAATPDWQAYYLYDRWRPTFWISASTQTSFFAGPATDADASSPETDREHQIEGGVVFPVRHARTSHTAVASLRRAVEDFSLPTRTVRRNRTAARAGWSTNTAHTYGYSISPEQGVTIGGTAELVRQALGAVGDATTLTADARAYLPTLAAHHVAALRVAAGTSAGNPDARRTFLLGGAGPDVSVLSFARDAASLLRGFGTNAFAGSHVALLNADYRFPLARPQRGIGTWPLFVQTIHAAIFADAGHAWTRTFRAHDLKTAAGAELSTDVVAAYVVPLTATIGVAWGHDGSGASRGGAVAYFRIGRAF